MSQPNHTFGSTCRLAHSVTSRDANSGDCIPPMKAHFFYSCALPIDDPLSPAPAPAGDSKVTKHPPRPFSVFDNAALEEAWMKLAGTQDKPAHKNISAVPPTRKPADFSATAAEVSRTANVKPSILDRNMESSVACASNATYNAAIEQAIEVEQTGSQEATDSASTARDVTKVLPLNNTQKEQQKQFKENSASDQPRSKLFSDTEDGSSFQSTKNKAIDIYDCSDEDHGTETSNSNLYTVPCCSIVDGSKANDNASNTNEMGSLNDTQLQDARSKKTETNPRKHRTIEQVDTVDHEFSEHLSNLMQGNDAGTTGMPFLKLPSRKESPRPQTPQPPAPTEILERGHGPMVDQAYEQSRTASRKCSHDSTETETPRNHDCKAHKSCKEATEVPVGICRLHLVKLPALQMQPIYWSPVHDCSAVTRGTWFYKDSMCPVEPAVANQLEMGYRELRPWSQTWSDELNCALEVGAVGEEKIVHRLWPIDDLASESRSLTRNQLTTHPQCAARCFQGEASAEGLAEIDQTGDGDSLSPKAIAKRYPNSQVIYKDAENAFILKPNLQPSAYYSRKPLQKIRRGAAVGVHCIRGFDWKSWEKLHPNKPAVIAMKAKANAAVTGNAEINKRNICGACKSQEEQNVVTDLCLVIHGIGQKLSERVESFHFTHAINALRCSVNAELGNDSVRSVLRASLGGVMVLPVNWRSNLSFEEGGPMKPGDEDKNNAGFTLKAITPNTIPAVRNLISDVMLDIPYYMSNHKTRMIQALVCEANRVYRLWCKNNPGFDEVGRVHIIAHSLGSVMALDVLSHQPTLAPKLDLRHKINDKSFDFNTTNFFCAGSPCGFFLLLEKGCLLPRRSRRKPDAEPGDEEDEAIVGDKGTFGCLAVDNIYNIMHCNDPIAYRLNATVDPSYAASLRDALAPSATTGFFEAIGKAVKSVTPGAKAASDIATGQIQKPPGIARLPSQLEMDVHDWTLEEIAEKKFQLLNDNGQIDYFMASGGGFLEFQYLNMLGAHSSYWCADDFVRLLVTEVGRQPGKRHTLPNMRAVKIGHKS